MLSSFFKRIATEKEPAITWQAEWRVGGTSVLKKEICKARPGAHVLHTTLGKVKLLRQVDEWLEVEIVAADGSTSIDRVRPIDCRQPTAPPK